MKCPKCASECWRDEHPDGIAAGLWCCSDCEWSEERQSVENDDFDNLPF